MPQLPFSYSRSFDLFLVFMIFFNIIRDFPAHTDACTNVQAVELGRMNSLQSLSHYQKLFFSILKPHNISFEQFNDLKIRLVKKLHMQKFIIVSRNFKRYQEVNYSFLTFMISEMMLNAISSGRRACIFRPTGPDIRLISSSVNPSFFNRCTLF